MSEEKDPTQAIDTTEKVKPEEEAPKQAEGANPTPPQEIKWQVVDPASFLQGRDPAELPQESRTTTAGTSNTAGPDEVDAEGVPGPLRSFLICQQPDIEVVPYFVSTIEMAHLVGLAEGNWPVPQQPIDMVSLRFRQSIVVERIENRMAAIAGLPIENLDRIRVVRYFPVDPRQQRPLHGTSCAKSVFAWLGELPPDCGAASTFPALGIACTPRTGAAIIWPDCKVPASPVPANQDPEAPPPLLTPLGLDVIPPHQATNMIMYALLGVFQPTPVRNVIEPASSYPAEEAAPVSMPEVDPSVSMPDVADPQEGGSVHKFALETTPQINIAPKFCLESEIDHLLSFTPTFRTPLEDPLPAILGLLQHGSDQVVGAIESRFSATAGLPLQFLGQLRVVSAGRTEGYCNRGCGARSVYVCMSDTDEVFFPYLGIKVAMKKGDAIVWPNATEQSEGTWVEDVRATRVHLGKAVGLEAVFCDWPARVVAVPRPPPLEIGSELKLCKLAFKIKDAIGMGSFGMVWGAQRLDHPDASDSVVIKEVVVNGPEDAPPTRETYEYLLLERLAKLGDRDSAASCALSRIPLFVDSQSELVGPQMWRMRFAMGRVPGLTMDNFILKCLKERHEAKEAGKDIVSIAAKQSQLSEACHFAKEMVAQLAPTLALVSELALHRDVNSHNVMVDGDLENPKFYLVDFGLAVDNDAWFGPMSLTSFHMYDIGGDCRYWPVAGWLMFLGGYDELKKFPILEYEYSRVLDFHALGLLAMQGLCGLAPAPRHEPPPAPAPAPAEKAEPEAKQASEGAAADKQGEDDKDKAPEESKEGSPSKPAEAVAVPALEDDGLSDEMRQLFHVWNKYWFDAHRHWEFLFNAFRQAQDFGPVKQWCAQNAVHNIVAHQMCWVRQALRLNLDSSSLQGIRDARPLFSALLELISAGLCEDAPDRVGMPPEPKERSWEVVIFRLCAASDDTANTSKEAAPQENGTKQEDLVPDEPKAMSPGTPTDNSPARPVIRLPASTGSSPSGRVSPKSKDGTVTGTVLPIKAMSPSMNSSKSTSPKSPNKAILLQGVSPKSTSPGSPYRQAPSIGSPTNRLGGRPEGPPVSPAPI